MEGFFTYAGYYLVFLVLRSYLPTLFKMAFEWLKNYFIPNTRKWTEKYGQWAGSTDGIGKAYARELARNGLSIVLISRNQEKLDKTATEIRDTFNVQTKTVQADFNDGPPIYEKIERQLCGLDIGILVNNVGTASSMPTPFHVMSSALIWEHVEVNVRSILSMTKMILPQMQKRNKGAIVNVSSIVAIVPVPGFSVYSATKAFITNFTSALQFENRNRAITIQLLSPSFVKTPLTAYGPQVESVPSILAPTPEEFACQAIKTLGYSHHTVGYWPYIFQTLPMELLNLYERTCVAGLYSAVISKLCESDIKNKTKQRKHLYWLKFGEK